jgi:hypothetical protein
MAGLDPTKISVGDIFYGVKDITNAFHRKKIHRIIDGEDWFKYDMPPTTYKLITYEVLGILSKRLVGEWEYDSEYELRTELYVRSDASPPYTMDANDLESANYFLDKEEATVYIDSLYAKDVVTDQR